MKTIECRWEEYGQVVKELNENNAARSVNPGDALKGLSFRGQSNADWELLTTLERYTGPNMSVIQYNAAVVTMGKLIQSWATDMPAFTEEGVRVATPTSVQFEAPPNIELAIYLRHHGFPSPYLDWSESPYVAAFFAMNNIQKSTEKVSVTVLESPRTTSGEVGFGLHSVGRYIAAGRRHFNQQARYTWCSTVKEGTCYFDSHANQTDERLTRIVMPAADVKQALHELRQMNITEFSMLGSTDALIRSNLPVLEDLGLRRTTEQ